MINLNPFINLIDSILGIYSLLLFCYVIIFYLLLFKIINPYSQFVIKLNRFLAKIFEPVLAKIRRYIPPLGNVDISIIVLFLAIQFFRDILYNYFYVY